MVVKIFDGRTHGSIVPPRGPTNFGWDPVFEPASRDLTYAQMDKDDKNEISHRGRSLGMLKVTHGGRGSGGGRTRFMHDRSPVAIGPRFARTPGRNTSVFTNQANMACTKRGGGGVGREERIRPPWPPLFFVWDSRLGCFFSVVL